MTITVGHETMAMSVAVCAVGGKCERVVDSRKFPSKPLFAPATIGDNHGERFKPGVYR